MWKLLKTDSKRLKIILFVAFSFSSFVFASLCATSLFLTKDYQLLRFQHNVLSLFNYDVTNVRLLGYELIEWLLVILASLFGFLALYIYLKYRSSRSNQEISILDDETPRTIFLIALLFYLKSILGFSYTILLFFGSVHQYPFLVLFSAILDFGAFIAATGLLLRLNWARLVGIQLALFALPSSLISYPMDQPLLAIKELIWGAIIIYLLLPRNAIRFNSGLYIGKGLSVKAIAIFVAKYIWIASIVCWLLSTFNKEMVFHFLVEGFNSIILPRDNVLMFKVFPEMTLLYVKINFYAGLLIGIPYLTNSILYRYSIVKGEIPPKRLFSILAIATILFYCASIPGYVVVCQTIEWTFNDLTDMTRIRSIKVFTFTAINVQILIGIISQLPFWIYTAYKSKARPPGGLGRFFRCFVSNYIGEGNLRLNQKKRTIRYLFTAMMVGVMWYFFLLIPQISRDILWSESLEGISMMLGLICAGSLVTALLLRPLITFADKILGQLVLTIVFPAWGCLFFWLGIFVPPIAREFIRRVYCWYHNVEYSLFIPPFPYFLTAPLFAVALSFVHLYYVVIPVGFLSQALLRQAARNSNVEWNEVDHKKLAN